MFIFISYLSFFSTGAEHLNAKNDANNTTIIMIHGQCRLVVFY